MIYILIDSEFLPLIIWLIYFRVQSLSDFREVVILKSTPLRYNFNYTYPFPETTDSVYITTIWSYSLFQYDIA